MRGRLTSSRPRISHPPLRCACRRAPSAVRDAPDRPRRRQNFTAGTAAADAAASKYSRAFAPVTFAVSTAGKRRMYAL